jgi:hypothetical protein
MPWQRITSSTSTPMEQMPDGDSTYSRYAGILPITIRRRAPLFLKYMQALPSFMAISVTGTLLFLTPSAQKLRSHVPRPFLF